MLKALCYNQKMNEQDKSLIKSILLGLLIFIGVVSLGIYTMYGNLVTPKKILDNSQIFEYSQKIDNQTQLVVDDYLSKIESIKTAGKVASLGPLTVAGDDSTNTVPIPNQQLIISWTNNQRSVFGLSSLKENSLLNLIAQAKMEEMFRLGYFQHISPTGDSIGDSAQEYNYQYASIGENLAQGRFPSELELVMAWMTSPGHRDNILGTSYREIGVAARKGIFNGQETILAVQVFAKPLSSCFQPNSTLKEQISTNQIKINEMDNELALKKNEIEENQFNNSKDRTKAIDNFNQMIKSFNNLIKVTEASVSAYNQEVRDYNYCLNH